MMSNLSTAVRRTGDAAQDLAAELGAAVLERGLTVATAESLTAGTIATVLAAAPDATTWFRGSVAAYSPEVKFGLLGVPRGPVVNRRCAETMARATAAHLDADLCVAVTGLGGPDPDPAEGEPPGAVWFAVVGPGGAVRAERRVFDGKPVDVLTGTTAHALTLLRATVG